MLWIVPIIVGAALLLFGRRLYWLLTAGVGFLLGFGLVNYFFHPQEQWVALAAGAVAGLIGAGLVRSLERTILNIAGLVAGGAGTYILLSLLKVDWGIYFWVAIAVAAIIGLLLMQSVFNFALIALSSYAGANLVLSGLQQAVPLTSTLITIIGVGLVLMGIAIQLGMAGSQKS